MIGDIRRRSGNHPDSMPFHQSSPKNVSLLTRFGDIHLLPLLIPSLRVSLIIMLENELNVFRNLHQCFYYEP